MTVFQIIYVACGVLLIPQGLAWAVRLLGNKPPKGYDWAFGTFVAIVGFMIWPVVACAYLLYLAGRWVYSKEFQ